MKYGEIQNLQAIAGKLREPEDLFRGKPLPGGFALPDKLLLFHHDWIAPAPNAHHRYTLVLPLADMTYFVDQTQIEITAGTALLIRPHQLRYLHPGSKGYGRIFITFELPHPQAYLPEKPLAAMLPESWLALRKFIRAYRKERIAEAATVLIRLFETLSASPVGTSASDISTTSSGAIGYINRNLHRSFTNRDIAQHLHVSESNLRLIFRRETGISLGRYIAKQRLDAARHRLCNTTMTIDEIAASCGYRTIYAFSHFFKHETGISPLACRKAAQSAATKEDDDALLEPPRGRFS